MHELPTYFCQCLIFLAALRTSYAIDLYPVNKNDLAHNFCETFRISYYERNDTNRINYYKRNAGNVCKEAFLEFYSTFKAPHDVSCDFSLVAATFILYRIPHDESLKIMEALNKNDYSLNKMVELMNDINDTSKIKELAVTNGGIFKHSEIEMFEDIPHMNVKQCIKYYNDNEKNNKIHIWRSYRKAVNESYDFIRNPYKMGVTPYCSCSELELIWLIFKYEIKTQEGYDKLAKRFGKLCFSLKTKIFNTIQINNIRSFVDQFEKFDEETRQHLFINLLWLVDANWCHTRKNCWQLKHFWDLTVNLPENKDAHKQLELMKLAMEVDMSYEEYINYTNLTKNVPFKCYTDILEAFFLNDRFRNTTTHYNGNPRITDFVEFLGILLGFSPQLIKTNCNYFIELMEDSVHLFYDQDLDYNIYIDLLRTAKQNRMTLQETIKCLQFFEEIEQFTNIEIVDFNLLTDEYKRKNTKLQAFKTKMEIKLHTNFRRKYFKKGSRCLQSSYPYRGNKDLILSLIED